RRVMINLMEKDSIYALKVEQLKEAGAEIVEFEPKDVQLDHFLTLLNLDMKKDLQDYLEAMVKNKDVVKVENIEDVVRFNSEDSLVRIPYGQARFDGILADSTSQEDFEKIKTELKNAGKSFFDVMEGQQLDAILSINNYHAGYAAVAEYPALTVPMGYKPDGEPESLTFIGRPFSEAHLLRIGRAFEAVTRSRKIPDDYRE